MSTPTREVFLDTETTSLDKLRGDVIEAAWAVGDGRIDQVVFLHTLEAADPAALAINRYYERGLDRWCRDGLTDNQIGGSYPSGLRDFRAGLMGATVIAENYGFDLAFLNRKLGFEPWHYRPIELSSVAMTVFDLTAPESMHKTAERLRDLGFTIPEADHTAAADVACLRACYRALRGGDVLGKLSRAEGVA